jgi:hypothetical protein
MCRLRWRGVQHPSWFGRRSCVKIDDHGVHHTNMPCRQAVTTAPAKATKNDLLRLSLDVCLPGAALNDEGAASLVAAIVRASNAAPLTLSLAGNRLTAAFCGAVGSLLEVTVMLTLLDLSQNPIEDAGAQLIAAALVGNTSLQLLLLRDAGICTSGAEALADAGKQTTALLEIDLRNNDGIISSDALALAKPLILLSVAGGNGAEVFVTVFIYKKNPTSRNIE